MTACPRCRRRYPEGRLGHCPACLLEAELPPALLGDHLELVEEIGAGGMGTVWKARDLVLGRTVAVKFLAPHLSALPDFERRLEREARAMALLDHPGIVRVHDFGREDGGGYIVMEYVEGRPLSDLVPLPADRAVAMARALLAALSYAHERGVVHRDVKPQNVLVAADGSVKVTDFGIARLVGGQPDPGITTIGRVIGTPRYLAPEAQAGAAPDPRMDVFAAGVLLREMGEGRNGDLPPALARVVARATAHAPSDRYATAAEMARDLAGVASGTGDLLPEERTWLRAVALVATLATAVALWALLVSITPRVVAPGELPPLVMVRAERLPDGRILSRARFETGPTLAALAAAVLALAAQAALRRHWRSAGLEALRPDSPIAESRTVLVLGAVSLGAYLARQALDGAGIERALAYVPILGGLLETVTLFFAWVVVFQALRTSRPLVREWRLWLGLGLALVPPVRDLLSFLHRSGS